jgi:plasmid stabilization system protein ParE
MAQIVWTEEAERWLRDIHDYIAADNPEAASKVVAGIFEKAQILRRFPEIGHRHHAEPEGEIRILLYGHYRIEQRTDLMISTLRGYVVAMGGTLHLVAQFEGRPAIEVSGLAAMDKDKEVARKH